MVTNIKRSFQPQWLQMTKKPLVNGPLLLEGSTMRLVSVVLLLVVALTYLLLMILTLSRT